MVSVTGFTVYIHSCVLCQKQNAFFFSFFLFFFIFKILIFLKETWLAEHGIMWNNILMHVYSSHLYWTEEKRGSGHMMMASTHWKVERAVAIAMVGIMPAALFVQGALIDHIFTTFVYLHGHWSVQWVDFLFFYYFLFLHVICNALVIIPMLKF